ACKWGLQKDLYPGHPYRLSICGENFDDEVPEKPADKQGAIEPSKQDPKLESRAKISQSKEFCGAIIDLSNAKTKTLSIGFCAQDTCEPGKERLIQDYEYQDIIRWNSADFARSGDRDLILERLAQKKDFISVILYMDGKKELAQLPLLSLDEALSKECLN
ncbi:MAG: hypothetical protein EBT45_08320, partial [Alphaproteobacteria bacterium]|nr:hypothetical protein [Alphaproteobacteria bacterium]